jgi:23S rRNA (guanosine2251-2'-O)-methyltransferase
MKQKSKNSSKSSAGKSVRWTERPSKKGKDTTHKTPVKRNDKPAPPKRGIKAGTRAGRILAEQRELHGDDPRPQKREGGTPKTRMTLFGIHACEAAIMNPTRAMQVIYCTDATENMAYEWVEKARKQGIKRPDPVLLEKQAFDRALPKNTVHQGIGIDAAQLSEVFLPDIMNITIHKQKSVIVLLDQVTDPHNLGAVMRSACVFGADAIIVQSKYAPELNGIVAKTACGAVEHLAVVYETNLARAIETLQEQGYFALALDERGEKTINEAEKYNKTILVLGAEGAGLRPLIREKCDVLVKLPTSGALSSLNVSNAAAVALYAVIT